MSDRTYYTIESQPVIQWVKAKNATIVDSGGREYIDFSSGCLIANSGHGNSSVQKAISSCNEAGLLCTYGFDNPWKEPLCSLLAELSPHQDPAMHLLSTGSEAVEFALKVSLIGHTSRSPEKPTVVSFRNGFHGRTLGAQYAGGSASLKSWIPSSPYQTIILDYPQSDFELARMLEQINSNHVAAIIFEPYIGGTVEIFEPKMLTTLRDYCTKVGALLIADEVQSGCYRTGHMFFSCRSGVVPDIIVMGKGVSSSVPLSVVLLEERLLKKSGLNTVSSTHGGNAMACAAGLANLEYLINEDIGKKVKDDGAILAREMNSINDMFPHVTIRGVGMVYGIEFQSPETASEIVENAIQDGVLLFNAVGPTQSTIKICPPLTIEKINLEKGLKIFKKAIINTLKNREYDAHEWFGSY